MEAPWSEFKIFVQNRLLSIQYITINNNYHLKAFDGYFNLDCILPIGVDNADTLDFETNFKAKGNKTFTDSDGIPLSKPRAFSNSDGFRFRGKGIHGTCTAGTNTNVDYKLTEERWINGVDLMAKNQLLGDSIKFQVVDKDYAYAGILYPVTYGGTAWSVVMPTGVVLDEFGTDWYLAEDTQKQEQVLLPYPARVLVNLYIRLIYNSTGSDNVELYINLFLHKKT